MSTFLRSAAALLDFVGLMLALKGGYWLMNQPNDAAFTLGALMILAALCIQVPIFKTLSKGFAK